MSGICGILRLDGRPPLGIQAMVHRLGRRGPDGSHVLQSGACALGHAALHATPEARQEVMPLIHAPTGCAIVADLRLDNREELIAALGLSNPGIGDGEITLQAYLRWGEDCPARLLGDFAFAVWDPRAQRIFCARDPMGMKQLIYCHIPGGVFAFASEPQAVLQAEGVPRQVNPARVADFFEGYLEHVDLTSTFFADVLRLPPAHRLTVTPQGMRLGRYWQLEVPPPLRLAQPADYIEAFRAAFDRAVQRRMRAPEGRLGSMLSGGIDSNAVAAVAADLRHSTGQPPLPTYSAVGPDAQTCVETRTIRLSQAHLPVAARSTDWSDMGAMLPDLHRDLMDLDDPFDGAFSIIRAVYHMAAEDGRKVVLDGVAGDVTLGVPMQLPYLLLSGRWGRAAQEIRGEAQFYGNGWQPRLILRQALLDLLPLHLRAMLRRVRNRLQGQPDLWVLPEDFAQATAIRHRQMACDQANRLFSWSHAEDRARALTAPALVVGRERYDRTAARYGIEPRDPFLDLDLVRLALSLPADQLQRDGIRKRLLRDAMADLLPEPVRYRRGKEHLGAHFTEVVWGWEPHSPLPKTRIPAVLRPVFLSLDGYDPRLSAPQHTNKTIAWIFDAAVFRWLSADSEQVQIEGIENGSIGRAQSSV